MSENEQAAFDRFMASERSNEAWAAKVRALPLKERAKAVVEEVIGGGEISLGEALRLAYPEASTGDLAPGADFAACRGLTVMVELWVQSNVPGADWPQQ